MLTVENYSDPPRISDLSFEVNSGELVLLLGGAGAGKSRLMRALAGLEGGRRGRILIDALAPVELAARSSSAFVFQQDNFDGRRSVLVQMLRRLELYGLEESVAQSRVFDWIQRWDLPDLDKPACQLDLASLQIASLGLGMLPPADIVLLDEPAQNLGASKANELLELLRKRGDRAVLALVSPPTVLAEVADRVVYATGSGDVE